MTAFVVAIDGPAASGKSTTARLAAERLGFLYLDTGAMYRAITWKALESGVDPADSDGMTEVARTTRLEISVGRIVADGVDVTERIRSPEISRRVSEVASVPGVRRAMVARQREIAGQAPCVVEGRDIGTVVFPDAAVKVFLVASIEERARRRAGELAARGIRQAVEEIAGEIRTRDERDSRRDDSPLTRASDAVELDTTALSVEEQVDAVVRLVEVARAG